MPDEFPRTSLATAAADLQRPFAPASLSFKVQATWPKDSPKHGLIVPYIDARTVSARLDYVAGPHWGTRFDFNDDFNVAVCYLTVFNTTRADIGKGGGFEQEKASASDALKRAAVHFGVGRYIYALSKITLHTAQKGDEPTLEPKGKSLALTTECDRWLREGYGRWLASERNRWGSALDHWDEADAVGDPTERLPVEATEPSQPDLEEAAKRDEIEKTIKNLNGGLPRGKGKGYLRARLKAAASMDDLTTLEAEIGELSNV